MGPCKSLDEFKVIAASLHDVFAMFPGAFSIKSQRLTLSKVTSRCESEGLGFLTKTLPKLGKAFDKALSGCTALNATELRLTASPRSQLPRFLGELFSLVLSPTGELLQNPNIEAVGAIRQLCYCFYKYELNYTDEQKNSVIQKFVRTEDDLSTIQESLENIRGALESETSIYTRRRPIGSHSSITEVAREAKILLSRVFSSFDPLNIVPRHGPGAVATKQKLWEKFHWTNVSDNITRSYPLDAYYYASLGHVCDCLHAFQHVGGVDLPAQVILVPKDSRGPRLISCEPVDYQWIQQGLGSAIVDWLEKNDYTKYNIHFTDQKPNQRGAILGSLDGRYATLDLSEASDRISLSVVRLLFPQPLLGCLESCRSSSTCLPNGDIIKLRKFAPMGSSLCFPILATTIWAILTAAAPDEDTRNSILVYGDDVIVPATYVADAMIRLESFGLKINRDKSCTSGFFRESCGTDAFKGINVAPVRLRTVWSSNPSPDVYESWIAYANSLRRRRYFKTSEYIAGELTHIYGDIPTTDMGLPCPSLDEVQSKQCTLRRRTNKGYQTLEWKVRVVKAPLITRDINGWSMLLRFHTESRKPSIDSPDRFEARRESYETLQPFDVRAYTRRNTNCLKYKWVSSASCFPIKIYETTSIGGDDPYLS